MKPIYVPEGKLDENQRSVYDLRLDASFIVQGCAGSGKTSLAMLRMQQRLAEYRDDTTTRFYYIAFVRELVECIRRDMRNSPQIRQIMDADDFLITYNNWEEGYISDWIRRKFGIKPRSGMMRLSLRESRGRTYENIEIAINKRPDYLFVDECQDLEMNNIADLIARAQKGIAFYGDDAQHIMNWTGRHPVKLKDIQCAYPDKFPVIHQLLRNYRLPKAIAEFAQEIGGKRNLAAHCRSPYNEKPILVQVVDWNAGIEYMVQRIRNLDLQDVAVVIPTNEKVRGVHAELSRMLGGRVVSASWNIDHVQGPGIEGEDYSYLSDTRVKIMTYEKIKGQQFETVFLVIDGEMDSEQIKRFYVGVTRAERFLYVLYGTMPAFLRQIPIALYNTSDETVNFEGRYHPTSNGQGVAQVELDYIDNVDNGDEW